MSAGIVPDWPSLTYTQLRSGRDRARILGEIAEDMNTSRRTVEKAIETLRVQGFPVCTGREGVWLTDVPEELRAQYRALRRRYIRQAQNARVLLATANRYERVRQMEMGL